MLLDQGIFAEMIGFMATKAIMPRPFAKKPKSVDRAVAHPSFDNSWQSKFAAER
jgi:hypothetical protein